MYTNKRYITSTQLKSCCSTCNLKSDVGCCYILVGTYEDPSAGLQKLMEVGTIIGDKVYIIQYIADAPSYSDYLPTVLEGYLRLFDIYSKYGSESVVHIWWWQ
jgi:hypothetical protein